MKRLHGDNGEILVFNGHTIVNGIQVEVVLCVNTVRLIHELGARAAGNRGRRVKMCKGAILVKTDKEASDAVRKARALYQALQRAKLRPLDDEPVKF